MARNRWAALGTLVAVLPLAACSVAGTPTASTDYGRVGVTATRTVAQTVGSAMISLSPNGQYVFYVRSDRRACIVSTSGGAATCTPKDAGVRPGMSSVGKWAPNSSAVVFTDDYQTLATDPDVWVMRADDGSLRDITDDHVSGSLLTGPSSKNALIDMQPTWLNATTIVFARQQGVSAESMEVSSVKATGGAVTPLFRVDDNWQFLDGMAAAPGGTTVAYSIADDGYQGAAVHVRHLKGAAGNDRVVAHSRYDASWLSFSTDGRYLLVDNRTTGSPYALPKDSGAVVVELAGRTTSRVAAGGGAWFPTWSPTGHALAFLTRSPRGAAALNLVTAPGGKHRKLASVKVFPVVDGAVQWAPGELALHTAKGLEVMAVTTS